MGLVMGAKADTDLYLPGFLRNYSIQHIRHYPFNSYSFSAISRTIVNAP